MERGTIAEAKREREAERATRRARIILVEPFADPVRVSACVGLLHVRSVPSACRNDAGQTPPSSAQCNPQATRPRVPAPSHEAPAGSHIARASPLPGHEHKCCGVLTYGRSRPWQRCACARLAEVAFRDVPGHGRHAWLLPGRRRHVAPHGEGKDHRRRRTAARGP